jgi:hypothetical protein
MATATSEWRERLRPDADTVYYGAILVNVELVVLFVYLVFLQPLYGSEFNSLWAARLAVYPMIWINLSLWALWRTTPAETTRNRKLIAGVIGVAYFVVLAWAAGLFALGPRPDLGLTIRWELPPGFSPAFLYNGNGLQLALFPYEVLGYLTLAYLVYATVVDAAGAAVTGLLGLVSCVSCTWPIAASLLSGVIGGATGASVAALGYSYGLSTVVFAVTVLLLTWRPMFGSA